MGRKSTLYKKLEIVKMIFKALKHKTAGKIHQAIVDGDIKVIDKRWHDRFKSDNLDMYPLNIEKPHGPETKDWRDRQYNKLWSTYDEGFQANIDIESGKIMCNLTCWDGRLLDGERTEKRWSATLELKSSVLELFANSIEYKYRRHLLNLFDAEEELRMENRLAEISKELLK